MPFLDVMRAYFRGEAIEAWFFILPSGLFLVVLGATLLRNDRTAFDWGMAVPCVLVGLILAGTGIGVGARTPNQVKALEAAFVEAPSTMANAELPRMVKVAKNFHSTFVIFGIISAIGLALRYGIRRDWAEGVGTALILTMAVGMVIDSVAERRTRPYMAELNTLAR